MVGGQSFSTCDFSWEGDGTLPPKWYKPSQDLREAYRFKDKQYPSVRTDRHPLTFIKEYIINLLTLIHEQG